MKTKDKAREAFEEWYSANHNGGYFDRHPFDGRYENHVVNAAWQGYQAATQANAEALREVLDAMENTDYHHDLFMQVSDCKDFCQEERLMQLGNLLQACEDQNKAIAKLKDMINETNNEKETNNG